MNNPEPGDKQMCEDLKRKLEEADRRIADLLQKLEKAEAENKSDRESETRLAAFSESVEDLLYSFDVRKMRIDYISPNVERLGYSYEEVIGAPVDDFVHPHDRERVGELLQNTVERGKIVPAEFRLRRKDGTYVWVEERGSLVADRGTPVRIVGVMRDISDRKDAERALEESEVQFRMLTEMTSSAVFIHRGGKFVYANPACERISGYSRKEILQMNFWDVIHPDMKEEVKRRGQQRLIQELTNEPVSRYEIMVIDKSGNAKWIMYDAARVEYKGEPAIIATAVDITGMKQAEQKLRRNEEKYRLLIDNIPAIMLRIDAQGKIVFANRMFLEATGLTMDELRGTGPEVTESVFAEDEREKLIGCVQAALEQETGQECQVSAANPDGTESWFYHVVYPWYLPDGTLGGAEILGQDVTRLKQAEEKARKLQQQLARSAKMEALGRLAAGVAHDLSNILSPVVGYPDVMLSGITPDDPLHKPLTAIRNAGEKATSITGDLLTIARRGVLPKEPVNLNDIVEEYLESPSFEDLREVYPGISVHTELDPGLAHIEGASVHLLKTVMNLVTNAADAMPQGGVIEIRTENRECGRPCREDAAIPAGTYALLTVEDSGVGIREEDLGRIFEPFYSNKVREYTGTGLGLTVVRSTVEDHGGYIRVESSEKKGTVFEACFPVTDKQVSHPPEGSLEHYRGDGSVLVVDEVREQREIVQLMLARLGYTVVTAGSGEEAVAAVRENDPDLVLVEMILGSGIDSLETCRRICEASQRVKIILTGKYAETEIMDEVESLGIVRFLKKPYTMRNVGMTVKEEMEKGG